MAACASLCVILQVLYPACEDSVLTPQCDQPRTYLGMIRLATYVGLPVVVLLILMIVVHTASVRLHKATREALKSKHPEQRENNLYEEQYEDRALCHTAPLLPARSPLHRLSLSHGGECACAIV